VSFVSGDMDSIGLGIVSEGLDRGGLGHQMVSQGMAGYFNVKVFRCNIQQLDLPMQVHKLCMCVEKTMVHFWVLAAEPGWNKVRNAGAFVFQRSIDKELDSRRTATGTVAWMPSVTIFLASSVEIKRLLERIIGKVNKT
jgi:hypothetical protein